jgi:hypothetical protein
MQLNLMPQAARSKTEDKRSRKGKANLKPMNKA